MKTPKRLCGLAVALTCFTLLTGCPRKAPTYCSVVRDLAIEQGRFDEANFTGSGKQIEADAVERYAEQSRALFGDLVSLAPQSVRGDVEVLAAAARKTYDQLRPVQFDLSRLPKASDAEEKAVQESRKRFDDYNASACAEVLPRRQ